jgi:hypothetical protein
LPVSSRRTPSGKKICAVAEKRSGTLSNASSSALKNRGSIVMSLFNRHTCEYRAFWIPRLTARANDNSFSLDSTRTVGNSAARNEAVPSSDPLSTTITSPPTLPICATTSGSKVLSRSLPLREGITTETPRGRVTGSTVTARAGISACRTAIFHPTIRAHATSSGRWNALGCRSRHSSVYTAPPGEKCHTKKFRVRQAQCRTIVQSERGRSMKCPKFSLNARKFQGDSRNPIQRIRQ